MSLKRKFSWICKHFHNLLDYNGGLNISRIKLLLIPHAKTTKSVKIFPLELFKLYSMTLPVGNH